MPQREAGATRQEAHFSFHPTAAAPRGREPPLQTAPSGLRAQAWMSPKNVPDTAPAEQQQQRRQRTEPSSAFTALQVSHLPLWRDLLVATCRARPVVRPPPVETADPEYRVLMNAGKAPPAVAGPIWRPSNFEGGSPFGAPLRPATRGQRGARGAESSETLEPTAEARNPRIARLSGAAARHLLPKFAGFRIGAVNAAGAFPAFMRTRCSWPVVRWRRGVDDGTRPRRWRGAGQGPLEHVGPASVVPRVRGRRAGHRNRGEALARCRRAARSMRWRRSQSVRWSLPQISDGGDISAAWLAVVGPELLAAQATHGP